MLTPGDRAIPIPMDDTLLPERDRLVRLCAHLSGDPHAAEDLAQETMIEAWRHAETLRDPDAVRSWLSGIARNVCLRWRRRQGRERAKIDRLALAEATRTSTGVDAPALDTLERDELATLLTTALAALPPTTREPLVMHVIHERSQADIARALGVTEGAVAVRIHRGKQCLREALAQPWLRADAIAYGLIDPCHVSWQSTRVWCPLCGRHRLEVRLDDVAGLLAARCAGACAGDGTILGGKLLTDGSRGLKSIRPMLRRELIDLEGHYREILATGESACGRCGHPIRRVPWPTDTAAASSPFAHGVLLPCHRCGAEDSAPLSHLLLDTPLVQDFWRRHPRMRVLGVRTVEMAGRDALVSGFVSVDGSQTLEIVSAADTFEILHVAGAPAR